MWELSIRHAGQTYKLKVDDQRDLLSQMREQLPLPLRRACKNGVCTICRCRLVAGSISYGARKAHGLWEQEVRDGYILPCIALPGSDLVIDQLTLEVKKPASDPDLSSGLGDGVPDAPTTSG